MSPERRAFRVKQHARSLGFDTAGITDLRPTPHGDALKAWLDRGMAATMTYMHRQAARRMDPSLIVPGATRAVAVTKSYFMPDPPQRNGFGRVAKYARGRDYHVALRSPLEALARYVASLGGEQAVAKYYVDAGPVPERELAQRAGLGWIGKNTMFIDPQRGSFLFLATVLTNVDVAIDAPFEADRCGSCRLCIDACPTGALPEDRVLDSRLCISYLTIEHRGDIDVPHEPLLDDWVFGCDLCQDVCPWNVKFAAPAGDTILEQDPSLAQLSLAELASMSTSAFDQQYGWTPLERPGAPGMRRNARIASANVTRKADGAHSGHGI